MPWVSIIMALVSFLMSKSSGASTGKSAAIAAAAGLGTYYLADPANPDNLLGITFGGGAKTVPGSTTDDTATGASTSLLGKVVSEAGATARSWGPTGTLGVVAGTTAVAGGGIFDNEWVLYGGIALLAFVLLK